MRPMDFAFMVLEGLPVEAEYMPIEAKTDKLQQTLSSIMPQYPATITYSDLRQKLMLHLGVKERAAEKNVTKAVENGYIIKNQVGCYYQPKIEKLMIHYHFNNRYRTVLFYRTHHPFYRRG